VFMKVLLGCLASRPPGFGGKEAAAAGAAAGAALSVLLNWLRSLLEIFAGFAERKELQWAARVSRYVLKWLEDASASVLLAEAAVEGAIAFENAPAQALRAERLAKAVAGSVRVLWRGRLRSGFCCWPSGFGFGWWPIGGGCVRGWGWVRGGTGCASCLRWLAFWPSPDGYS